MKPKEKRQSRTILWKLLGPITLVLLIQAVIFDGVFLRFIILPETMDDAFTILNERVINKTQYLEKEMVGRWSNIKEAEQKIIEEVEMVLEEKGASIEQIKYNGELNQEIINRVSSDITYILHKNGVTGSFIILDGPAINGEDGENTKASFYVRNLNLSNYPDGNSDVLLQRGLPSIAKKLKLPLGNNWAASLEFSSEGEDEDEKFFFEPLRAVKQYESRDSFYYGYWSDTFRLQGDYTEIITYSIPLMDSHGNVFGVMGIDLTLNYLLEFLNYKEMGGSSSGTYVLALADSREKRYHSICINAQGAKVRYAGINEFIGKPSDFENIYEFQEGGSLSFGSVQPLNLYNKDTPFVSQQWVLLGLKEEKDVLCFHNRMRWLFLVYNGVSLLVGTIGIYMAGRQVTRSIRGVVNNLNEIDPSQPVYLKKLDIEEIDELTGCIEKLSWEVAEASSQISKIIDMINAPIGVYEYKDSDKQVLCSLSMFHIMNWEGGGNGDNYVERDFFEEQMRELETYLESGSEHTYKIQRAIGFQWIKKTILKGDARTLGMLMDVTSDMVEIERIAYERDYDLLTDIYNRRAFHHQLDNLFEKSENLGIGALLMFDMDNLKYINDTYGHDLGDQYIKIFCSVIKEYEEYDSVVARRSGDEFYVFIYGFEVKEALYKVIMKVWEKLQQKDLILPNGNLYSVRVSGGIAWFPQDSCDWKQLVRYADFAMYAVKHERKGNIREFSTTEYRDNAYLLTGREALDRLLYKEEIKYFMQPIVETKGCQVYGYEMLMRSPIPELAIPSDIVKMSRIQSELYQLERVTWFKAMETYVSKIREGLIERDKKVFINSVGSYMMSDEDIQIFENTYSQYLSNIVLELTESEEGNEEYSSKKARVMKEWGGMLAIDDFSKGYNVDSILVYLNPEIIKVDMSIIRNIDQDPNRQKLLDNIISYAETRDIKILAEGIETKEELKMVIEHGVDLLQGYYISHPESNPEPVRTQVLEEIQAFKEKFT